MYYILPKRKVCFSVAEKCGTESIRYLILKEQEEENPEKIWHPNYIHKYRSQYIPEGYTHIAIIRNPYERLVSGYLDKVITGNYYRLDFIKKAMRFYNRDLRRYKNRLSFEEFVNYIIRIPGRRLDIHFRPQTVVLNLTENTIFFDIKDPKLNLYLKNIGFKNTFDNYRMKYMYTWKKVHIPNAYKLYYNDFDIAENRKEEINGDGIGFQDANVPLYKDFYNEDLKDKIYRYFINDFKILKYNNSI
jgi:hypothetical protein